MASGLGSVRGKLDRGREHATSLLEGLERDLRAQPLSGRIEIERQLPRDIPWQLIGLPGLGCATLVLTDVPTVPADSGLLLGDVLQNYRSALDHLAWLAVRRVRPNLGVRTARQVGFPLARTRRDFNDQRDRKMPGVSDEIWEFVEQYQPYHRSPLGRGMRQLRNLSDTDKHRVPVPTLMALHEGQFMPQVIGCQVVAARLLIQAPCRVKVGTRFGQFFYAYGAPSRLVGTRAAVTLVPALAADVQLEQFLNGLDTACREIVEGAAALL